ncbi:MAG: PAS domain-containing protein, partial [Clostridiales bacterium]
CSVGIAVSSTQAHTFELLYKNADKALYNAKCCGRNMVAVYGEETADTAISKWINDTESILDAISDSIYICDKNTYELIYANDYVCKFAGVTQNQCKGKKCYEILMHKTEPCEFCPLSKMTVNNIYTRLFRPPNTSKTFLMRGKDINWNGTVAHLEVAVDISKVDNMNLYWEDATDYEGK